MTPTVPTEFVTDFPRIGSDTYVRVREVDAWGNVVWASKPAKVTGNIGKVKVLQRRARKA